MLDISIENVILPNRPLNNIRTGRCCEKIKDFLILEGHFYVTLYRRTIEIRNVVY